MKNKFFPYRFVLSFWFSWLVLSILYITFDTIHFSYKMVTGFIGLFVPIGINSYAGAVFEGRNLQLLLAILLISLFIFFADKILYYKLKVRSGILKMVINLIILFILTFIVDMIIWQHWYSLTLFLPPNEYIRYGWYSVGLY